MVIVGSTWVIFSWLKLLFSSSNLALYIKKCNSEGISFSQTSFKIYVLGILIIGVIQIISGFLLFKQKKAGRFDVGIKLMTISGHPVAESIYKDEANHIIWSKVLDSIFSNFKNFVKERIKPKGSPRKSAKK